MVSNLQLLKGYGVTIIKGDAEFKSSKEISVKSSSGTDSVQAKYFIVATGSRPIEIPGFKFDEKDICSSTGALAFDNIPKRIAVIGGGYIGLEISSYLRKLGTEVTVIEAQSSLLAGVVDPDCAQVVVRKLTKAGVNIIYGGKAKSQKKVKDGYEVTVEINGKEDVVKCDKILVTVGRRPNGDQGNLKAAGIAVDERGFIKVDAQRRTSVTNIFAIGDVAGQPMLAHKASHEGVLVALDHHPRRHLAVDGREVRLEPRVLRLDISAAVLKELRVDVHEVDEAVIKREPEHAVGTTVIRSGCLVCSKPSLIVAKI